MHAGLNETLRPERTVAPDGRAEGVAVEGKQDRDAYLTGFDREMIAGRRRE